MLNVEFSSAPFLELEADIYIFFHTASQLIRPSGYLRTYPRPVLPILNDTTNMVVQCAPKILMTWKGQESKVINEYIRYPRHVPFISHF